MKKEVIYPAAKCIVTGAFAFVLAAVLWSWAIAALVGAGVAFAAWLVMQLPVQPVGLVKNNGDTHVTVKPQTTRIQVIGDASSFQAGRWADLPVTPGQLTQIAKRLEAGAGFGYAGLAGPGRPLSRSEFENLRSEFIARGLAYWINPGSHAQGVELTHAGRRVMEYFATELVQVIPMGISPLPQLPGTSRRRDISKFDPHAHTDTSDNGSDRQNPNSVNQKLDNQGDK